MPATRTELFDASSALWMKEQDAKLVSVTNFDGLAGMQIMREWEPTGRGLMLAQAPVVGERLDWCADADADPGAVSADCGKQGKKRYVKNPIVGGRGFVGTFVGGPLRWVEKDQGGTGSEKKPPIRVIQQLLTRVRELSDSTAVEGLKATRYEGAEVLTQDKPFREDIKPGVEVTLRFRYFTHESRSALEGMTVANMRSVLTHHLGASALTGWQPKGKSFIIDRETNGAVIELVCVRVEAYATLAAAPVVEYPATRKTLRMFGLRSDTKGEGYLFEKVFRWEHLTRDMAEDIEFPEDAAMLTLTVGNSPVWRVAEYKVDEDDAGLLSLTMIVARTEWTNTDDSATERIENPHGWGCGTTETIPSIPQASAEDVMELAPELAGHVLASTSAEVTQQGASDVKRNYRKVWSYDGTDEPAMPTHGGLTAPDVSVSEVGEGDGGASLSFPATALSAVGDVIENAVGQLADKDNHYPEGVQVRVDEAGAVVVSADAKREAPHIMPSYMATADYFSKVLQEQLFNQPYDSTLAGGLQEDLTILSIDTSKTPHGNYNIQKRIEEGLPAAWVTTHLVDAFDADALDGTRVVTVYHYRNQSVQPAQPELTLGLRCSADFQRNRFSKWDGSYTVSPNDAAWESERASMDYFGSQSSVTLSNRAEETAEVASKAVNSLKAVTKAVTASGLHTSTVDTETGNPDTWETTYTPDGIGVAGRDVKETGYKNQVAKPDIATPGKGQRVSVSLSKNKLGSWDGHAQEGPDDREQISVTNAETEMNTQVVTRKSNQAASDATVPSFSAGVIKEVTKSETLSGIHGSVVSLDTAKPSNFTYSYTVKRGSESGTATVYVYYNQASVQTKAALAGYQTTANWSKNRYGLYDGQIVVSPTFYNADAGTVSDQWHVTKRWLEPRNAVTPTADGDGREYRLVTEVSTWITTTSENNANSHSAAGMSGSDGGRQRKGLYWAKKVTSLTYGAWKATKEEAG